MTRARGAVALLAAARDAASSMEPLCRSLHACGCATLCPAARPGVAPAALSGGLVESLEWLRSRHPGLPLGVYGVAEGATAALDAAASRPDLIDVLVVLAADAPLAALPLGRVCAATLLVAGRDDAAQLAAHRRALPRLPGARRLEIVPGAGDRADALAAQAVAHLAAQWFAQRLPLRALH
ncbi:hypothetical protein FSC37_15350 [Piscinibacter aquaticus]|uniref:Alpha/beta hydrolase n=1 Tax=Piscinibacter aquaticus TaxID=392597 RepID=A0A5C6U1P7_9BURK|nr:hypothetical protein FSC37_15350 [Piscinibacter aquaticus]